LAVTSPGTADPGQRCLLGVEALSGTRDGTTEVRIDPVPAVCADAREDSEGCVTVVGRRFVLCDVAPEGVDGDGDGKKWTAGEFGNGRINNADVVRQFRISLGGEIPPPPPDRDLYSAMDVVGFVAPPC